MSGAVILNRSPFAAPIAIASLNGQDGLFRMMYHRLNVSFSLLRVISIFSQLGSDLISKTCVGAVNIGELAVVELWL